MVSRDQLVTCSETGGDIGDLLPGCAYPVLVRPLGSHAGAGLKKIEGRAALNFICSSRLRPCTSSPSSWTTYRRTGFTEISGRIHRSATVSLPHGLVAELDGPLSERGHDRECGQTRRRSAGHGAFRCDLRSPSPRTRLPLCMNGCHSTTTRSTAANCRTVACSCSRRTVQPSSTLMDPEDMFSYKHAHMRSVFDAFGDMLRRRATAAEPAVPR